MTCEAALAPSSVVVTAAASAPFRVRSSASPGRIGDRLLLVGLGLPGSAWVCVSERSKRV